MQIVKFRAENIKRLVAVEIKPTDNLVRITGKNGQGKTSILDAIYWAFCGADAIQSMPIRQGQAEAFVELDCGTVKVRRTFKARDGKEWTTAVVVEGADGSRYPKPQTMLDQLWSKVTMDPLEFHRKPMKGKFDTLKDLVPGVDFEAMARQDVGDRGRRTEKNAEAKKLKTLAAAIIVPDDTPAEKVDEDAIMAAMGDAAEHNALIERRLVVRQNAQAEVDQIDERKAEQNRDLASQIERINAALDRRTGEIRGEIKRLEQQLEQVIAGAEVERQQATQLCNASIEALQERTLKLREKLDAAEKLPEPISIDDLRRQLQAAKVTNANVARREDRDRFARQAAEAAAASEAITEQLEARAAAKAAAIAAAKLPIDGLALEVDEEGKGTVLLHGVPFDQASDAEQLRTSIAIAMAGNPEFRVIRVRDGSLLDSEAMQLLAEMAKGREFQVWLEEVTDGGPVGFVIEDGKVKVAPEQGGLL